MSLTDFRTLGRSGLVVSPLALGTMTFGPGEWGADEATSRAIFDAYRAAGGNFVDSLPTFIRADGAKNWLVGSSPTAAHAMTSCLPPSSRSTDQLAR